MAFYLTPGQTADIKGAVMLSACPPDARYLLADKAYGADHWRQRLKARRIKPVIPNKSNRKQPHPFNKARYKGRNVIERMFGRLKDFRRVASGTANRLECSRNSATFPVIVEKSCPLRRQ